MLFADFLVKCYPLDTQKPEPKFFDNSYIFHNGSHFDLRKILVKFGFFKKQGKIIFWVYFGSGLDSNIEEYCLKISINTMH